MNRLAIPIVAVAFLAAACGSAASTSPSERTSAGSVGVVQAQPAANAGSSVSDAARVQPAIRNGQPVAPVPAQAQQGTANSTPSSAAGQGRCSSGSTGAGFRASGPKHPPQTMCAVE